MSFVVRIIVPVMQMFRRAPFVAFFDHQHLRNEIARAGFEIEEIRTFEGSPKTWYIVARKL